MYVFDGLFILLLVFNTNDTDIKRKNRLIYFKRSNSTTLTSELIFPPSLRLQFDYYPLNSTIKILYAFLICPVGVPRPPPPNYYPWFDDHNNILWKLRTRNLCIVGRIFTAASEFFSLYYKVFSIPHSQMPLIYSHVLSLKHHTRTHRHNYGFVHFNLLYFKQHKGG